MIPHNMPLFKFICALYQFHHQTLPIIKIDRGQIQFRDYVLTGTEPLFKSNAQSIGIMHDGVKFGLKKKKTIVGTQALCLDIGHMF